MSGAVFVSYATQDAAAAQRLADALRHSGVEVWLDQGELQGGDAWDREVRERVRACALFLPIVSAATQARAEGNFRREWKLAAERARDRAAGEAFLLPVAIDDTPDASALVPDEFLQVRWMRLPGGTPTARFVERVKRWLAPKSPPTPVAPSIRRASGWRLRGLSLAALVGVAVLAVAGCRTAGRSGGAGQVPPVVVLMDTSFADRVYDPATLRAGGTNADDITEALHDLPVTIRKETTSATWHGEDEVFKMRPDLVVLHRSCFYTFPANRADELYPVMDNKLVAFFGYLATTNPRVRFIVYSRHSFEKEAVAAKWREDAAARFPVLAGRIETWRVPLDRATFRHPQTAQELRASVVRALGLRVTPGGD